MGIICTSDAAWLGVLGAVCGIGIALFLVHQLRWVPMVGPAMVPLWSWDIFVRAMVVALVLGIFGGLYPAYRATTMLPTEALRYE
jgi:putative ABC transport system permease protein